ncbi:hypothetical protein BV25DRAFT_1825616 [Artomyces pyxidatus]|uniref:Uncharacterized protein n=1 Tax=Artomyces pyxidatus TaxID=48021 RepID=A0ACB8T122_9AGAM|nr:hypothetical protein BV25DRAFT_1825616 [Artomyces pyxidatus]
MLASALAAALPAPTYAPTEEEEVFQQPAHPPTSTLSQSVVLRAAVPPYGQRQNWKPTSQEDFGA